MHRSVVSILTILKRTPPWWSSSPGPAAWLRWTRQNPRGTIFRMGLLRALSNNFVYLCESAKKKINQVNSTIYFIFLPLPNLIAPKTMALPFPHAPPPSNLFPCTSSITPTCFWLVVESKTLIGGHLRPWCIFVNYCLVWATELSLAAIGLVFSALVLGYKSFNCSMYQVPVPTLIEKFVWIYFKQLLLVAGSIIFWHTNSRSLQSNLYQVLPTFLNLYDYPSNS